MIDFQSPASAENANHPACDSPSPGGEGRDEGELCSRRRRSALIKRSSGRESALINSPNVTTEKSASRVPAISRSSVAMWPLLAPFHMVSICGKIPKPSQGSPRLAKPAQATSPGRGESHVWICTSLEPICGYLHLLTPINGFFPEKKDCLFLWAGGLGLWLLGAN
jgi:hypothetical protein